MEGLKERRVAIRELGDRLDDLFDADNGELFCGVWGRREPRGLRSEVVLPSIRHCLYRQSEKDYDDNERYFAEEYDYAQRLDRYKAIYTGLDMSMGEYTERALAVRERILASKETANLERRAAGLPIILPKMDINQRSIDKAIKKYFAPAASNAYESETGGFFFGNLILNVWDCQVKIVPESRHNRLLEAVSKGNVVAMCYPNCLQGFSAEAQIEQMKDLPKEFILSGLDIFAAIIGFPDVIADDVWRPTYDMTALTLKPFGRNLQFTSNGCELHFNYSQMKKNKACGKHAGGLVILG